MHNFVHSSIHTIHYLETASCVSKTIVHCKALVYDLPIGNERKAMKNLEVMLAPQAQGNNLDEDGDVQIPPINLCLCNIVSSI